MHKRVVGNRWFTAAAVVAAATAAGCSAPPASQAPSSTAAIDRTVLPIRTPAVPSITEMDARKATRAAALRGEGAGRRAQRRDRADRRHRLRAHQRLRRADQHADAATSWPANGLRYNRFHTTALCSPDAHGAPDRPQSPRQQRRRDHGAGDGVPRQHRRAARQRSRRSPRSCARTATAPPRSASITRRRRGRCRCPGPYDRWPTGSGFDKFYGFIGGETNQWAPAIYDGVDARRARRTTRTTTSPPT